MSRMIVAVVVAMAGLSAIIIGYMVMAGPFYTIMTKFDDTVSDMGISNLSNFWGLASPILKGSFKICAVLSVIGIIIWLYMWAQRKEYYTAGEVAYR